MFGLLSASIFTASVVSVTLLLIFFPALVTGFLATTKIQGKKLSPVILDFKMTGKRRATSIAPSVPGDGGSQLEAKLDKPRRVHLFCDKKTEKYFNLWLNPNLLFPGIVDCWVDNMRLVYNHSTRLTMDSPGVDVRVPGFGNTSSVEWLDPSGKLPPFVARFIMSSYYVDICEALVNEGYVRGINIRGAPYDYRKAPNELTGYYKSMKLLVEETYKINGQTKVTLVCHSMGCPVISYFLNHQSKSWKNTHIKGLISLGGAWAGAVKAMKVIASGENLGIMIVSQTALRTEQRTGPGMAYMLPSRLVWSKDEVLAMTTHKNYTVDNYREFFHDINFTVGYEMYKDTFRLAEKGLNPPGVEVHCLHGDNLTTPELLDFRKESSFPDKPIVLKGNGDGTVNSKSLRVCLRWSGKQKEKVYHFPIPNMEHLSMLSNQNVVDYVKYFATTW